MPRKRTNFQKAAGQLISVIQKEWVKELGEPRAEFSENVMHTAHTFLKAASVEASMFKHPNYSVIISNILSFSDTSKKAKAQVDLTRIFHQRKNSVYSDPISVV